MKNILLLVFLFPVFWSFAQEKVSINGFIFDAETHEPLIGANIMVASTKYCTISNKSGYYSLTVPYNDTTFQLQVSFIGYQTKRAQVKNSGLNNISLRPGLEIGEVQISQNRGREYVRSNETGIVQLQPKQIDKLPNFFGESDIIKALQLTPGIQSGGEAKSDLYVRGGSPDQNLILLDGVPLYYISHFGGFLSVFNTDAISDINLIKGGFPARFGNRLSSVLEVRMKEGNAEKIAIRGTVGLMSSKILVEGPMIKNKVTFMLSARKNIVPVLKILGTGIAYNFYDFNAKLTWKPTDKDKVFLSSYFGNDKVAVKNKLQTENIKQNDKRTNAWGNRTASLRWNHVFSNKLFGNNTLAYVGYDNSNSFEYALNTDFTNDQIDSRIKSGIYDVMLNSDFNWYIAPEFTVRFGQSTVYHQFVPNDEEYNSSKTGYQNLTSSYHSLTKAFETAIYGENDFSFQHFGAYLGLRLSRYHVNGNTYYSLEPRILANFMPNDHFSLKYSWSKMNQYVHLLSYSGVGMPNDFWMPSTGTVHPEKSMQNTLGVNISISDGLFLIGIDSYYKRMDNLIAFKPGASLTGQLSNWEDAIESSGTGKAYGLELFIQKPVGKTSGWAGITLSKSKRTFTNLNNGEPFPFKYDRLLDASLVVLHELNKRISLSGTWTFGTGYPVTVPMAQYPTESGDVFVYDKINGFRMRDYHRLDLAVNIRTERSWGEETWTFSIFNVYNRANPYYYYFNREVITVYYEPVGVGAVGGNIHLYQKSLFRFFPSFAYSFKF